MADVIVRSATADDIDGLTSLKVLWADLTEEPSALVRDEFRRALAEWITARPDTVLITVAEDDHELVGMAWLVVFERVPNIDEGVRMTGDVQSVFVRPGHRRRGIARALVSALLSAADDMTIPRVTVSANEAAARMYVDLGFTRRDNLLERRMREADDH
jgi:GNAT superfamily N-acetyltransferase